MPKYDLNLVNQWVLDFVDFHHQFAFLFKFNVKIWNNAHTVYTTIFLYLLNIHIHGEIMYGQSATWLI